MNKIIKNLLCFWHIAIWLPSCYTNEEIIKDDTMKEWYHQTFMLSDGGELWSSPTVSDTFSTTCGIGKDGDVWLISKHVSLSETFADLIYVDVETSEFKLCFDPRSNKYVPCYSNYFQVYVYHGQNEPNIPDPGVNKAAVKNYLLNNFSPVYNITNNTSPVKATNRTEKHTFTFHQNQSKGITFGIRSRGACGRIYRMKMYYYYCEETCKNRVMFPKTISPADGSREVPGNCSVNSTLPNNKTNSNGSCSSDGTWSIPDTVNCSCIQGYSSDRDECGRCSVSFVAVTSTTMQNPSSTTNIFEGNLTTTIISTTSINNGDKSRDTKDFPLLFIIIIVVGSGLLLVLLAVLIMLLRRRKKRKKRPTRGLINNGVELPSVGHRIYVDPTIYDKPEDALTEFTNEIDPSTLFLEMMIGGGEFGDVYKGTMTKPDGSKIPVAVKTLKHDATAKSEKDFLLEASVMGQFENPNVIQLEGVVTKSSPRMIVTEFMNNGSLDNFLTINDSNLTVLQLIGMARGVAAGMKYLAEMNFVHRDLAARNILVNDSLFCKVADFGLSRGLETTDSSRGEYATTGGKIPVRWTAPEAIAYRKFSSASDVWSYGILLWEIMTFGERPYYDWDNFKVLQQLDDGYRLPAPKDCPKVVHNLMLDCWKKNRNERPSFAEITAVIDRLIRSPETMENDVDTSATLSEWLESIKMQDYLPFFTAAGYHYSTQLISLDDEALRRMGIPLVGHRNKILKNIGLLRGNNNQEE